MEITDLIKDSRKSIEIDKLFLEYCGTNHIPACAWNDKFEKVMSISSEELLSLTYEECFAHANELINYSIFLQKLIDRLKTLISHIESEINKVVAANWANYDKYLPADVKRQTVINDNSYLQNIEALNITLKSADMHISEVIKDVRRKVSLFHDLAKRKSFT